MDNPFEMIHARLENIENLLLDIKHAKTPTVEIDRWFTLGELKEYLPDKPVSATVYGWVQLRKIPNHKSGKKLRFLKSEIDLWLKEHKREAKRG